MWVVMFTGLPASGKSYLRRKIVDAVMRSITDTANDLISPINEHELAALNYCRNFRIVQASSDDVIDMIAATRGTGYSEVFDTYMSIATDAFWHRLHLAIACRTPLILVDRTFVSEKARADVIKTVQQAQEVAGVQYKFMLVNVLTPEAKEWERRLNSRPGKIIPAKVLDDMARRQSDPRNDKFVYDDLRMVYEGHADAVALSIKNTIIESIPEFA